MKSVSKKPTSPLAQFGRGGKVEKPEGLKKIIAVLA